MALAAGTRIGPYEIAAPIGAGGMGEVYRARDGKLLRDVALKILPHAFASNPDRLGRFKREAQVLASLNHPNIAAIYGIEEGALTEGPPAAFAADAATAPKEGGHYDEGPAEAGHHIQALVLELVEGPTLADRIARGALAVEEALGISRQIAEALEAAHEKGIVHRDLKPANVKITPDGKVKVLDFGLAKALDDPASVQPHGLTQSPTLSVMATQAGIILGTAAYMSPEQAEGRQVDHRSDIFSFGTVLCEMLTGRAPFGGETAAGILASVLARDPDLSALPSNLNPRLGELLRRCLEKNVKQRWQAIGDVHAEIEAVAKSPYRTEVAARPSRSRLVAIVAIAVAVTALLTSALWLQWPRPVPRPAVVRFAVPVGSALGFTSSSVQTLAVSPDGTEIVFAAGARLHRRALASLESRVIPGTDAPKTVPGVPVYSPDGKSIAFVALTTEPLQVALKRVDLETGSVVTLTPTGFPFGVSWDAGGILIGQGDKGILRVSPRGGTPTALIAVKKGELAQGPQMLPDGDHVLFTLAANSAEAINWDEAQIVVQSIRSGERKTVIRSGSEARYVATGHIVYAVAGALFAVPFDAERLEVVGERRQVLDGVRRSNDDLGPIIGTAVQFAISDNGTLVYIAGGSSPTAARSRGFSLSDRKGAVEPMTLPAGMYESPRISPDGRRLAFAVVDEKDASIYVYDLDGRSQMRRITFGGRNRFPVWSPDSLRLAFQSNREGDSAIWVQRADGNEAATRLTMADPESAHTPESWAGTTILFGETRNRRTLLKSYSVETRAIAPFADVASDDPVNSVFSPDGRWVAYTVREGGDESHAVYVQPFPATGARYQISRGEDAHHPIWTRDGTELLYIPGPLRLASVSVTNRPGFSVGNPSPIPRGAIVLGTGPANVRNHDITPDGMRFVGIVPSSGIGFGNEMQVVLNWTEELKRLVPTR